MKLGRYGSLLLVIGGFLLTLFCQNTALALSPQQRLDIERRPWYDPTDQFSDCDSSLGTASGQSATTSGNQKVYIIGDSIAAGTKSDLESALKAGGYSTIVTNAVASRRLSEGSSDLDGISVLQHDQSQWSDASVIIIELGTNGGLTGANIEKTMSLVKPQAPNAHIFWVNIGADNNKRSGTPIPAEQWNSVLTQNTTKGYSVIDWASAVKQHPEYIDSNPATGLGVHPSATPGRASFASIVTSGITATTGTADTTSAICCNTGAITPISDTTNLSGDSNAQKIFNFLIGKGLTPVQAAAIIGSLKAESGLNPKRVQGTKTPQGDKDTITVDGVTGYGIAQWTSRGRQEGLVKLGQARGLSIQGDLNLQLDYLWQELNSGYKKSVLNPLQATSSLPDAVHIILYDYENPAEKIKNFQVRLGFALNILKQPWAIAAAGTVAANTGDPGSQPTTDLSNAGNPGASFGDVSSCGAGDTNATLSGTAANKVVAIAQQEYAAGANEANKGYLKYTAGANENWCADFVSWVLSQAGTPFTGGVSGGWRLPAVASVHTWFAQNNRFHPARSGYVPKSGDIVIYQEGKSPYPDHVNIVIAVNGKSITTIGGNESSKIGQTTQKDYDASYITGYGDMSP